MASGWPCAPATSRHRTSAELRWLSPFGFGRWERWGQASGRPSLLGATAVNRQTLEIEKQPLWLLLVAVRRGVCSALTRARHATRDQSGAASDLTDSPKEHGAPVGVKGRAPRRMGPALALQICQPATCDGPSGLVRMHLPRDG
jgi:hypothetical protein